MMLSVRLDEDLERLVRRTAQALDRTRSDVVKASLRDYCERVLRQREVTPFALVEDLLGRAGSGRGDLSTQGRKYLMEFLHARQNRRSR
jgi:hypothetical protein